MPAQNDRLTIAADQVSDPTHQAPPIPSISTDCLPGKSRPRKTSIQVFPACCFTQPVGIPSQTPKSLLETILKTELLFPDPPVTLLVLSLSWMHSG